MFLYAEAAGRETIVGEHIEGALVLRSSDDMSKILAEAHFFLSDYFGPNEQLILKRCDFKILLNVEVRKIVGNFDDWEDAVEKLWFALAWAPIKHVKQHLSEKYKCNQREFTSWIRCERKISKRVLDKTLRFLGLQSE